MSQNVSVLRSWKGLCRYSKEYRCHHGLAVQDRGRGQTLRLYALDKRRQGLATRTTYPHTLVRILRLYLSARVSLVILALIIWLESRSFRSTKVYSKNGRSDIAEAKYFSDEGIIIGEGRFSDRDLNVPDQKLRPSDLTFLQWKSAAGDAIKSLRGFVGRNILSKSTIETMQKAQRDTRQPLSEKATFERGADTPEKKAAFNMMMGTDFISSLGYMLKDHAPISRKCTLDDDRLTNGGMLRTIGTWEEADFEDIVLSENV
ncbi:MAG: hypothetical protein Q9221_006525 [Calogaya cf. arnoldii]